MEIKDKIISNQKLAIINYKGPIGDFNILIAKLMGWVESKNIETDGGPFIIYYSPRSSIDEDETVFDVGIPILNDVDGTELINIVEMIEHNVLSGIHKGSYDNILDSYEKMVNFAAEHNFDIIGSPKEILIKNIHNTDNESEFLTEIQLPIIKM
ncbi:MAG: GyrI-like domain-containing protein [Methanobrevibacter sp.]|jgi:effector-binding domain-containing protein|nr:GyrI-like domain-containing protein [Methanobrevibacter sp.]